LFIIHTALYRFYQFQATKRTKKDFLPTAWLGETMFWSVGCAVLVRACLFPSRLCFVAQDKTTCQG